MFMNKLKNAVYLLRCLGFLGSLSFIIHLVPRYFGRFTEGAMTIKTIIRSHQKIDNTFRQSIIKNLPELPASLTKQAYTLYSDFNLKPNLLWHRFFISLNHVKSPAYISEDLFYTQIEPNLNQTDHSTAYSDKNGYDRLFTDIQQPRTILRFMNGSFFDRNYSIVSEESALKMLLAEIHPVLFKPSIDSGQGRNIFKLTVNSGTVTMDGGRTVTLKELKKTAPTGFIIQEILSQHHEISEVYPDSLNTIRIITLRLNNEVFVLNAILKMGNGGHFLDKMAFGGLCCGINNNGQLFPYAYNSRFKKYERHPQTKVVFEGKSIPGYQKLTATVTKAHSGIPYFNMISWDMAVSPDKEPVLIELNLRAQGILYQQAIFGPLFGERTEVLIAQLSQT